MIAITKADGFAERALLSQLRSRSSEVDRLVSATVSDILYDVRLNGDDAVREYTLKFDGVEPETIEMTREDMEVALSECEATFVFALHKAAENIRDFHQRQKQQSWLHTLENGSIVGQRVRGLERVGIYVPGGTAAYPSSVLMNAIPAKIAGVKEIVMVTPPTRDGTADKNILAAAAIAGVDRAFLVGGAQAVAALAYGTDLIPRVDKIVGPGNIYVATAKKQLYGTVDIDMIAGPSEIVVVADETANPRFIAADMLAQAEHDTLASAILLTTSQDVAEKTCLELSVQIGALERRDIIEKSLTDFGAVVVFDTLPAALAFADELAPEHLEICVKEPMNSLGVVNNAGSVFLGDYSPESLGDYYAGPNHVLPTGGTARFFSPLSVDSFIKKMGFIHYTRADLNNARRDVVEIANAEGLSAHANSIKVRF